MSMDNAVLLIKGLVAGLALFIDEEREYIEDEILGISAQLKAIKEGLTE